MTTVSLVGMKYLAATRLEVGGSETLEGGEEVVHGVGRPVIAIDSPTA